jgi:hypothetical protein
MIMNSNHAHVTIAMALRSGLPGRPQRRRRGFLAQKFDPFLKITPLLKIDPFSTSQ